MLFKKSEQNTQIHQHPSTDIKEETTQFPLTKRWAKTQNVNVVVRTFQPYFHTVSIFFFQEQKKLSENSYYPDIVLPFQDYNADCEWV